MKITIEAEPNEVKALIIELYPVQVFGGEYIEKLEKWTEEHPEFFNGPKDPLPDASS